MAAVIVYIDFRTQENGFWHDFQFSPSICHKIGSDGMIFIFSMLSFKTDLSLSSFTFIKRCWEAAWGIPPVANVMRKEARHMQRWDRASGVPLEILEHLPPKPESAYLTALCFHLHFWHYGGLSPTTSLWKGISLGLQLINLLGVTRVFQSKNSSDGSLACLTGLSGHMWLFTASQLWEARDALNFLNTDSFEKLENY